MTETDRLLALMAARVAADPVFLASRLGTDNAALRAQLGCDGPTLTRLRLCLVPRGPADIDTLARKFGLDAARLVAVLGDTRRETTMNATTVLDLTTGERTTISTVRDVDEAGVPFGLDYAAIAVGQRVRCRRIDSGEIQDFEGVVTSKGHPRNAQGGRLGLRVQVDAGPLGVSTQQVGGLRPARTT